MSTLAERLFAEAFEAEVLGVAEEYPDTATWSAAGRGKNKAHPQGEDGDWWRTNGPLMVANWVKWRTDSGWKIWTTPDGVPAIELEITVPRSGGTPLRAIIDRVMINPQYNEPVILDVKSGARTPESDLQLGVYKYAIFRQYGIDIRRGTYWLARKGEIMPPFNLARLTPRLIDLWYDRFELAASLGIFIPRPTVRCRACSYREYCTAFGGRKQHMDPDYAKGDK